MAEPAADTPAAAAGAKRRTEPNNARQLGPPKKARTRTSPRAKLSWSTLTPELLGRIAKNLAVGSELVSFCTVVGKDVARVVKQMYLYRNDAYLVDLWKYASSSNEAVCCLREMADSWMACNEGYWQMKCLGRKCDANLYTVTVSKEDAKKLKLRRTKFHLASKLYHRADQWPSDRPTTTSFILAIGGVDVSNMPVQEATELLRSEAVCKDGRVRILCIDTLSALFSHPCNACDYGLDRVVKHLLETGIVDPKTKYCASEDATCTPENNNETMLTLLQFSAHALYFPACFPVFKYLLTVDEFDVNATDEGRTILHYLSIWNYVPSDVLALLLKHPGLNVNTKSTNGHTAVGLLVRHMKYRFAAEQTDDNFVIPHSEMMEKLRLLLEAGVDATLRNNAGKAPMDHLIKYENAIDLSKIEGGEQLRRDIHEVRALLGKYV